MNYTLHQLQIFYKIVEKQSITKAAEELYLTQPAVSIQLKKFQNQFDIPLTEVVGRQLFITDFGKEIAEAAEKILIEVEAINYKTLAYKGNLAGKLKIAVVSTGKYVMPYFLSDFMKINKGVDLSMDVTNKTKVIQSLEENAVDFALVSIIPDNFKTNNIQLMKNVLYLMSAPSLAIEKATPRSKIFKEFPLLFREEGSATRSAMEDFMHKNKLPTFKKMEFTSNEALKQALLAGLGYSVVPLIGTKNELKNGDLKIIPITGLPIITHWNLIWLKAKKLSPIATAYLEFIKEEKEKIIQEKFYWFEKY